MYLFEQSFNHILCNSLLQISLQVNVRTLNTTHIKIKLIHIFDDISDCLLYKYDNQIISHFGQVPKSRHWVYKGDINAWSRCNATSDVKVPYHEQSSVIRFHPYIFQMRPLPNVNTSTITSCLHSRGLIVEKKYILSK